MYLFRVNFQDDMVVDIKGASTKGVETIEDLETEDLFTKFKVK